MKSPSTPTGAKRHLPTWWGGQLRALLQTVFALALLVLWLRTVSLGEVLSNARVQSWGAVLLMLALFFVTSLIRARRWLVLLQPIAPVCIELRIALHATRGLLTSLCPTLY